MGRHVASIAVLMGILLTTRPLRAQEGDVVGVHDPAIIKEGAYFYVFSTHGGIYVRRSTDLYHWQNYGEVLPGVPDWAKRRVPSVIDLWAPDISFFNGKYHLYYAVSTWAQQLAVIGLATNTTLDRESPKFHWIDEGFVMDSIPGRDDYTAIDPNVAFDQSGTPWLTCGSFRSGIVMVRLDRRTGKPVTAPFHIAGRNGAGIEAPYIIRRGRYYYLFVSFDQCCEGVNSTYKIMVGRSVGVTGPYLDHTGRRLSDGGGTLVLTGYARFCGPGHNSIVREGNTDYLVHHFYDAEHGGRNALQIRPLILGRDGWPVAGEPIQEPPLKRPAERGSLVGRWQHGVNFDPGNEISLLADGTIANTRATWRVRGSSLQMRWYKNDIAGGVWVDDCYISPDGMWYVGRNQQGAVIRGLRKP
jgi:arabinan endo-1,5-alpha-L-arabinosidase